MDERKSFESMANYELMEFMNEVMYSASGPNWINISDDWARIALKWADMWNVAHEYV